MGGPKHLEFKCDIVLRTTETETDLEQTPRTMSVAETTDSEVTFMFRFNLSPSDGNIYGQVQQVQLISPSSDC
jgi:hypothetical protein